MSGCGPEPSVTDAPCDDLRFSRDTRLCIIIYLFGLSMTYFSLCAYQLSLSDLVYHSYSIYG